MHRTVKIEKNGYTISVTQVSDFRLVLSLDMGTYSVSRSIDSDFNERLWKVQNSLAHKFIEDAVATAISILIDDCKRQEGMKSELVNWFNKRESESADNRTEGLSNKSDSV